jgi:hypothetical protein
MKMLSREQLQEAHRAAGTDSLIALGTRRADAHAPPAHDAVLTIVDWLPVETVANAALVAALLALAEKDAAWLLRDLETGCLASATAPVRWSARWR